MPSNPVSNIQTKGLSESEFVSDDLLDSFEEENLELVQGNARKILIFMNHDPSHPLSHLALRYAKSAVDSALLNDATLLHSTESPIEVFFYGDGANIANRLRWQPADQVNLTKEWQKLAKTDEIALNVCVSTALSRGIIDSKNAQRHALVEEGETSDNLAEDFKLVGLSELITNIKNYQLVQF